MHKYMFIGKSNSGKTSLIQQLKSYLSDPEATFTCAPQPVPTKCLEWYILHYRDSKERLTFLDIDGLNISPALINSYLRNVNTTIFCCIDLNQPRNIEDCFQDLDIKAHQVNIIFIATKIDLLTDEAAQVQAKKIFVDNVHIWQQNQQRAQDSNQIFYTSAKTGAGIQELGKWFSDPLDIKLKACPKYLLEQTIKENLITKHDIWTFSGCIAFSRYTDDAGQWIPAGVKQILNIINNNNTYTQAHVDEILSIAQSKIYDSSAFFGLSRRSDDTKKFYQNIVATIENYNKTTIKLASSNQSPAQTSLNPQ